MKKVISLLLSVIVLLSVFSFPAHASFNSLLETEADIVLLVSLDNGSVIFDKNADKRNAPASLTKIVTCLLVLENCKDLNTKLTCTQEDVAGLYAMNASTAGILPGETMTVRDLLYCLMLPSAADAANILANYIGGNVEHFVEMMNDYVAALGCKNTHFINPHGLDENGGAYITANDLCTLVKHGLENETFKEITSTPKYQIAPTNKYGSIRYLNNTNKMMNPAFRDYYHPAISGVKTGTTDAAGHCVVSTASQDGYNYLLVVLNAPQYDIDGDNVEENCAFTESKKIYEWAFKNIELTKVTTTTDIVTVVDVNYSWKTDHLRLVPAKEISALVPTGTQTGSLEIKAVPKETKKSVDAPVKKGDIIGKANVLYGEDVVATVDLVAAESVNGSIILKILGKIKSVLKAKPVKILLAVVLILVIAYFGLIIRKNAIRAKRRKPRRVK